MRTGETKAYCLITGRAGSLAVGVDAVEAVVDANRFVRLPLCPRPVWALCIYRGGILPIVRPFDDVEETGGPPGSRLPAVLVLRTGHGLLGLSIDRGALAVVENSPAPWPGGPPAVRMGESARPEVLVAAGSIERDGQAHAVLDVDRTWTAIRGMIERGYGANRGGASSSAKPPAGASLGADPILFDEEVES